ncbi:UNVERIFIED_CONTAM: hypothetical protein Scaly_1918500 [Sesamum calycinum]|uniref:CCHC-type domain-containing protein n=1 Tax=Sesamum calycinum TaxID=2727403 RepID=A0AAW2NG21_9LAMI
MTSSPTEAATTADTDAPWAHSRKEKGEFFFFPLSVIRRRKAAGDAACLIIAIEYHLQVSILSKDEILMECQISKGMAPANITASINTIPMLNGSNFKSWKENLEIVLGVMDLDLALREDSPPALTDKITSEQKREKERWEKSNRMCVMIMKKSIPKVFRGTMSETLTKGKDFLEHIEKRFVKMKKLKLFNQFKVSYNCQKETWSLNELISHLFQEEERLKQDKTECAYFASTSKGKHKGKKRKKDNGAADTAPQKKQQKESNDSKVVCYFCKVEGHIKKHCTNFHAWRTKKGLPELPKTQ